MTEADGGDTEPARPARHLSIAELKYPPAAERITFAGAYITREEARTIVVAISFALFLAGLTIAWLIK